MGGKGLSSASPVMLRRYFSPRPRPLGEEFLQSAGWPQLSECTDAQGITVQRGGPRGSGMFLVRSGCSVFRAQTWKTSAVMEVLNAREGLLHVGM